jgi:SAM-dependent methyltransferase
MATEYKLIRSMPSDQNVLDLFAGEWSTRMPAGSGLSTVPGPVPLLEDPRIHWLADELGPLYDRSIVELGPLEGAHSAMLNRLRPRFVAAVEANTRAYLKCLCMKEIFGLDRVHFKLGSFIPFLEVCDRVDVIVASGVLYHMTDPLRLLELIAARANRIFLWTHYYDEAALSARSDFDLFAPPERLGDGSSTGARRLYPEAALSWNGFTGGPESYAVWLSRDSVIGFFERKGYAVTVDFEDVHHIHGPSLALCAKRPGSPVPLKRRLRRRWADLTGASKPPADFGARAG